MKKVAKNLYLDPEALQNGETYGRLHRMNLSQLVSDFLRSLPSKEAEAKKYSPAVQRLIGVALPRKGTKTPADVEEDYHRYLLKKHGRER